MRPKARPVAAYILALALALVALRCAAAAT
jgi:hypothetical protein